MRSYGKKILLIILATAALLFCGMTFASCNRSNSGNKNEELRYELNEEGYTVIGLDAFNGINLEIPSEHNGKKVTEIGEHAFEGNEKLKSVTIPDSVTKIGAHAFDACNNLSNVILSKNLIFLGECAFKGCTELPNIYISHTSIEGGTTIGAGAFAECSGMTCINIPDTVTVIGAYAFQGCERLVLFIESSGVLPGWDPAWNFSNCPILWNCLID